MFDVLGSSIGPRTFRERLIETGEEVYVFREAPKRLSRGFGETSLEIAEGAEGGHPDPRTSVASDRSKETVSGGHRSGGRLAVALGCFLIAVGVAIVVGTPMV